MQIRMQNAESLTWEQLREFLKGSETIEFQGQNRAELYGWVGRVLVAQEYATQGKKQRGTVRAYIVQGDRLEPTPDHAVDPQVPRRRSGGSGDLPAAAFPGEIHESGRGAAGGSGPCAWLAERAGNGAHYAARTPTVRQGRVCASGGNLRGASVQSAGQRGVPQTGGEMGADASQCHQHRGAAQ